MDSMESILGLHVQEMRQASDLSCVAECVLVMDCANCKCLLFDALVTSSLAWLCIVVGAHAGVFGFALFWDGCGKWSSY